jgi:hypothetical protein
MLTGVIIGLSGGVIFSEFLCERAIDFAGLDYDDPFFSKMSVGIRIHTVPTAWDRWSEH